MNTITLAKALLLFILIIPVTAIVSAQGNDAGAELSCSDSVCERRIVLDLDDIFFEFNKEPSVDSPQRIEFERRLYDVVSRSVAQLKNEGVRALGTYDLCTREGCAQKCEDVTALSEGSAYIDLLYPNGGKWQGTAVVGEGTCAEPSIQESPLIDTAEFPPLIPGSGGSGKYATLDPKQVGDVMIGIANNYGLLSGIDSFEKLIALLAFKTMVIVTNPLVRPRPVIPGSEPPSSTGKCQSVSFAPACNSKDVGSACKDAGVSGVCTPVRKDAVPIDCICAGTPANDTTSVLPPEQFDKICEVAGKQGKLAFWESGPVSGCREVGDKLVAQISDWSFSFVYDMEFDRMECPDQDIPLDLQLLIGVKEYYCSKPYGNDNKASICSREITNEPLVKYCPVKAECGDGTIQNPPEICDPGLTMNGVSGTLAASSDDEAMLSTLYPSLGNSPQDSSTKTYLSYLSSNPSAGPQGWTSASCVTRVPTNVRGFAGTKAVFGECVDSCTRCDVCGDGRLINSLEECDPPGEECAKYVNAYLVAWDDIDSIHAIVGTDQYINTIARIAIELQGDCSSTCGCTVLPGTYKIIGDSSLAGQTFTLSEQDRSKLTAAPTEYYGRAIGSTVKAIPVQTSVSCSVPCTATMKVEKGTGNVFSISDNNQCPAACGECILDSKSYSNKRKTGEEDLARDVGHPLGEFKVEVYELSGSCQSSKK